MLRLSKKSDYALIAMKHLATRPDGGQSASAREISEWVQAVAKEQLSVRAKRVEEIELTNPILDSGVRDLMSHSGSSPPSSIPTSTIPPLGEN